MAAILAAEGGPVRRSKDGATARRYFAARQNGTAAPAKRENRRLFRHIPASA
jgi:hypothetical protein